MESIFIIFACCIPVKGYMRSVIYDLNRNCFYSIPNDLYELLKKYNKKSKREVYSDYGERNHPVLDSYFQFLEDKEIIFYTDKSRGSDFPELSLEWDSYSGITNAIVDTQNNLEVLRASVCALEKVRCEFIQIRETAGVLPEDTLREIAFSMENSRILNCEFILDFNYHTDRESLEKWMNSQNRISNVYLFNAPVNEVKSIPGRPFGRLVLLKDVPDSAGPVRNSSFFYVNTELFCESRHYNNFFNRKVYINPEGDIYNAPGTEKSYGNIFNVPLEDILEDKDFTLLWTVKKDNLAVCKDCEYRYMCVDGRIPLYNKNENKWYFDTPCNYDPYKGKWRN